MSKITIPVHTREKHDLQEFFCLLTKRCNSKCDFCIEKEVNTGGFVDEIKISYRGEISLRYKQSEWKTKLYLGILATEREFPTEEDLLSFVKYARDLTGMEVYVNTMNPVNQGSYDTQMVSYLEERFLTLPESEIFSSYHKAGFYLPDGTRVRMGNKSMNPGHPKYSMNPDGSIHDHFEHDINKITHDESLDEKLQAGRVRLQKLRELK